MDMLRDLNGTWYESTGDMVATVCSQAVFWPNGVTSCLEPTGKNTFNMVHHGEVLSGKMVPGGSIQWCNGDAWLREHLVESDETDSSLKLSGRWCQGTEDTVAVIRNQTVEWPHGLTSELEPTEDGCQMVLRGEVLRAICGDDGIIQWNNGDVWMRDYKFHQNAASPATVKTLSQREAPGAVSASPVGDSRSGRSSPLVRQNTPGTFASDAAPTEARVRCTFDCAMEKIVECEDVGEEKKKYNEGTVNSCPGIGDLIFPDAGVQPRTENSSATTGFPAITVAPCVSLATTASETANPLPPRLPTEALLGCVEDVLSSRPEEEGVALKAEPASDPIKAEPTSDPIEAKPASDPIVGAPSSDPQGLLTTDAKLGEARRSLMNPIPQPVGDAGTQPYMTLSSLGNASPTKKIASPRSGVGSANKGAASAIVHRSSTSPRSVQSKVQPKAQTRAQPTLGETVGSPVSMHGLSKTKFSSGSSAWAKTLGREIGEKFQSKRTSSLSLSPRSNRLPRSQLPPKADPSSNTKTGTEVYSTLVSKGSASPRSKSPPHIGVLAEPPRERSVSPTGRELDRERSVDRTPRMHHKSRATHQGLSTVKYTSGSSAWARSSGREIGDKFATKPRGSSSTLGQQRTSVSPRSGPVGSSPRSSPRALGTVGTKQSPRVAPRGGSVQLPSTFTQVTQVQVLSASGELPPRNEVPTPTASLELNYAFSPASQMGSPIRMDGACVPFGSVNTAHSPRSGRRVTPNREAMVSPRTRSTPRGDARRVALEKTSSKNDGNPKTATEKTETISKSIERSTSLLSPRSLRGRGEPMPPKWV